MTDPRCPRSWQIEARHDGRLTGAEAEAVTTHVERCSECREEQRRFESLLAKLRALSAPRVDEVRHARTKQRILAVADAATLAPERPSRLAVAAATATAVAAGALAFVWSADIDRSRTGASVATRAIGDARFSRRSESGHEVVALVEGELAIRVRHAAGGRGSAVTVHVPDGVVRDEGTAFRVHVRDGHTRAIVVTEGRVTFSQDGAPTIRVSAGERWVRAEPPPSVPPHELPTPAPTPSPAPTTHAMPTPSHAEPPVVAEAPPTPEATPDPSESEALEDHLYLDALSAYRAGDSARARRLAASYVTRFPNGFRRVEMQGLLSSIPPE